MCRLVTKVAPSHKLRTLGALFVLASLMLSGNVVLLAQGTSGVGDGRIQKRTGDLDREGPEVNPAVPPPPPG